MVIDLIGQFAVTHPWITGFLGLFILGGVIGFYERFPILMAYSATLILAFFIFESTGGYPYFIVFTLGMITALAEIIGKFRDEPLKAFRTKEAVGYHVLNGCISAFALWVFVLNDVPFGTSLEKLNTVIIAGLGSMLIMRSRLFAIKVGGEEVALGPEQVIKIYFRFMETAIDRKRAQSRITFVKAVMSNIAFDTVKNYALTMLDAVQTLDLTRRQSIEQKINAIATEAPSDQEQKSYKLGFLLMDNLGEDIVHQLFTDPHPSWLLKPPKPTEPESRLVATAKAIPRSLGLADEVQEKPVDVFIPEALLDEVRERMHYTEIDADLLVPREATLYGYQMEPPSEDSVTSLVEAPNQEVAGIIFRLENKAFEWYAETEQKQDHEQRDVPVQLKESKDQIIAAIFVST